MSSSSTTESDGDSGDSEEWISWFLKRKHNRWLVEVDREYIQDSFNLYGLKLMPEFGPALSSILGTVNAGYARWEDPIYEETRNVYMMIHARYILTTSGMARMSEQIASKVFGCCPRLLCGGEPLAPLGMHNIPGVSAVVLFCPKCQELYDCNLTGRRARGHGPNEDHCVDDDDDEDIYEEAETQLSDEDSAAVAAEAATKYAHCVDAAAFGTTFAHLYTMQWQSRRFTKPQLYETYATAQPYIPRIFGFRVHDQRGRIPAYLGDARGIYAASKDEASAAASAAMGAWTAELEGQSPDSAVPASQRSVMMVPRSAGDGSQVLAADSESLSSMLLKRPEANGARHAATAAAAASPSSTLSASRAGPVAVAAPGEPLHSSSTAASAAATVAAGASSATVLPTPDFSVVLNPDDFVGETRHHGHAMPAPFVFATPGIPGGIPAYTVSSHVLQGSLHTSLVHKWHRTVAGPVMDLAATTLASVTGGSGGGAGGGGGAARSHSNGVSSSGARLALVKNERGEWTCPLPPMTGGGGDTDLEGATAARAAAQRASTAQFMFRRGRPLTSPYPSGQKPAHDDFDDDDDDEREAGWKATGKRKR